MRPLQTCRKIRTTRKTARHGNKNHCPAILRQNKNEAATAPPRFHKKKEKNRTSCRFLQRNGTHPSTSRCPSFRPGRALWYSSSLSNHGGIFCPCVILRCLHSTRFLSEFQGVVVYNMLYNLCIILCNLPYILNNSPTLRPIYGAKRLFVRKAKTVR